MNKLPLARFCGISAGTDVEIYDAFQVMLFGEKIMKTTNFKKLTFTDMATLVASRKNNPRKERWENIYEQQEAA